MGLGAPLAGVLLRQAVLQPPSGDSESAPRPAAPAPAPRHLPPPAAPHSAPGKAPYLLMRWELAQQPVVACGMVIMQSLPQTVTSSAILIAEKCNQSASRQVLTLDLLSCRCAAERAATCQRVIRAHQADAC